MKTRLFPLLFLFSAGSLAAQSGPATPADSAPTPAAPATPATPADAPGKTANPPGSNPAVVPAGAGVALAPAATVAAKTPGDAGAAPASDTGNIATVDDMTVTARLDRSRETILPNLGATAYVIDQEQIQNMAQGDNASFNELILRSPGVAQDSAVDGGLHVRGEHANIQYRINGVLLPEGVAGFGFELDPHFIERMEFITGSLPAQYGFRTAAVVDITTKDGALGDGGSVTMSGGSFDTLHPSFEYGGSSGKLSYFIDGSYEHNDLGIESPTPGPNAIHDVTDQYKGFTYWSYALDDTSRVSFIGSTSYSTFQIPNTPGLPAGTAPNPGATPWYTFMGITDFNSAALNENQTEQNSYGVVTYQTTGGHSDFQISLLGRDSSVHFTPDPVGDLYFNGTASDVMRHIDTGGVQSDGSYVIDDDHTLRAGFIMLDENVTANSTTTVFPVDASGAPIGPAYAITDNNSLYGVFSGVYLQDEWKLTSKITLNYGARFDSFNSSFDNENQLSPRINLIFKATDATTVHLGYSRYFTPPPVENVPAGTVAQFNGTSNASAVTQDDPVKAERSDYFDAGITQKLAPGWTAGFDAYYKEAKNQLDDGLFGQSQILSAFNYAKGEVYGMELTTAYTAGDFSAYSNLAYSVARGYDINSAQFLFDPSALAYSKNNWIYLDHDQRITGTLGSAYIIHESGGSTRVYAELVYGSGLRTDSTAADGSTIPNGGSMPFYATVNTGLEQTFQLGGGHLLKARLDIVNIFNRIYELRDGSGVGVNAAQYGMPRAFFGSLTYTF